MEALALRISIKYYESSNFSRADVQNLIDIIRDYTLEYNSLLKEKLLNSLENVIDKEVETEIKKNFNDFQDPFKKINTEDKRLRVYEKKGLYSEPNFHTIGYYDKLKVKDYKLLVYRVPVNVAHLNMKNSLKLLLGIKGLFEETKTYINYLENEKNVIQNFIQGELWKEQLNKFKKHKEVGNSTVLPILIGFDGIETGNPLGSHAGKNEFGAVYATIPCLPPQFSSKLDSIILTDLFYDSDRKTFGNKKAFSALIDELKYLRSNGIEIEVNNKSEKIYFITSLIAGDNLGLNGILGFVESFSNTYFCRICKASPEDSKSLIMEDETKIRTVSQYELDILNIETSKTGIKEECIFHILEDFHVLKNLYGDLMHDVYEGTGSYVMARIIAHLIIVHKSFTIDELNAHIQSFNFGHESVVPPEIDMDYIKKNEKLKMSSSEILVLIRYFGCIVGHLVERHNQTWKLYKYLRKIIHILTAPKITAADISNLSTYIENHHNLYKELFEELKPKFHIMTHYARLIKLLSPLICISMMRMESKHRQLKKIVTSSYTKKNLLVTIPKRMLLSMINLKYKVYKSEEIKFGSANNKDYSGLVYFPNAEILTSLRSVIINDINYAIGAIILIEINEDDVILFGEITNIYNVDGHIYFKYLFLPEVIFDEHYFAYKVLKVDDTDIISYKKLLLRTPCVSFLKKFPDKHEELVLYVTLKHEI